MLGVGLVGANGRLNVSLPNLTLSGPVAPATLQFISVYFDQSFNLVIGQQVSWPAL